MWCHVFGLFPFQADYLATCAAESLSGEASVFPKPGAYSDTFEISFGIRLGAFEIGRYPEAR